MALTCLKGGTKCCNNSVKNPIYATPAVKGLILSASGTNVEHAADALSYFLSLGLFNEFLMNHDNLL